MPYGTELLNYMSFLHSAVLREDKRPQTLVLCLLVDGFVFNVKEKKINEKVQCSLFISVFFPLFSKSIGKTKTNKQKKSYEKSELNLENIIRICLNSPA